MDFLRPLMFLAFFAVFNPAMAEYNSFDLDGYTKNNLELYGFLTIGANAYLDGADNNVEFENGEQITFSNPLAGGLHANYKVNKDISATMQFIVNEANDFGGEVTIAEMNWDINDNFFVTGGRIPFPGWMYSKTSSVPYTFVWSQPPQFYQPLAISYDGVNFGYHLDFNSWSATLSTQYGHSSRTTEVGSISRFDLKDYKAITLDVQYDDFRFHATFNDRVTVAEFRGVNFVLEADTKTTGMGIEYDDNIWWIISEYSVLSNNSPINIADQKEFYFTAGRRFGRWLHYVGYEHFNRFDKDTNPSFNVHVKSVTAGTRWDVYDNLAVKAQLIHYYDFKDTLGNFSTQPTGEVDQLSLSVDLLF